MAVWVTARLDDEGKLTARVTASEPYGSGGRTATGAVDLDADALVDLRADLEVLIEAHGPAAQREARLGAARALVVASDRGEE